MEWSINEVAQEAKITSRTLRHYDAVGILSPSRTAPDGRRFYDQNALIRLQRILMLRELGLGLAEIKSILQKNIPEKRALETHLRWIESERRRLDIQASSVRKTIDKLERKEQLIMADMFEGFDHTEYKDEVEQRWGSDAYREGDKWWNSMNKGEQKEWQADLQRLFEKWKALAAAKVSPSSIEAQEVAGEHYGWLAGIPGSPADKDAYVRALAQMYVEDSRFAKNFAITDGDMTGASFVREALTFFVDAK